MSKNQLVGSFWMKHFCRLSSASCNYTQLKSPIERECFCIMLHQRSLDSQSLPCHFKLRDIHKLLAIVDCTVVNLSYSQLLGSQQRIACQKCQPVWLKQTADRIQASAQRRQQKICFYLILSHHRDFTVISLLQLMSAVFFSHSGVNEFFVLI